MRLTYARNNYFAPERCAQLTRGIVLSAHYLGYYQILKSPNHSGRHGKPSIILKTTGLLIQRLIVMPLSKLQAN